MAIIFPTQYPGRANPISSDYPQGSIKNKSAPGATDGTLLDQAWANDIQGFLQSLLAGAGVTANGLIDKVGASQYYSSLEALIGSLANIPDATESIKGKAQLASQVLTNAGVDDTSIVTPAKLRGNQNAQTLQNVSASRAIGTTYTNSSGRPILVILNIAVGQGQSFAFSVDGAAIVPINNVGTATTNIGATIPVPNGSTYSLTGSGGSIARWSEFR